MTIVKWKLGLRVLLSALKMHAVEIEKTDACTRNFSM